MGLVYYFLELLWDNNSHWTMIVLGGLCGTLIGLLNEYKFTWDMPLFKQVLIGEIIVLPLEFLAGVILNILLKLDVWDYSNLPFNIMGQSSLLFAFIFIPVILLAIVIDDLIRWKFFKEEKPRYKWI